MTDDMTPAQVREARTLNAVWAGENAARNYVKAEVQHRETLLRGAYAAMGVKKPEFQQDLPLILADNEQVQKWWRELREWEDISRDLHSVFEAGMKAWKEAQAQEAADASTAR